MARNYKRALNEGFGRRSMNDTSPVGWVKLDLDDSIVYAATSLDYLQVDQHQDQLDYINSRRLKARSARVEGALEDCIADMKDLLCVLDHDSKAPALADQVPLPELYTSMSASQRPARHSKPQSYAQRAQLLCDMGAHFANKALEIDSHTRAEYEKCQAIVATFEHRLVSLNTQVSKLLRAHGPEHTRRLRTGEHMQNISRLHEELKTLLDDWKQIAPEYRTGVNLGPQIQEQMIKLERVRDRMNPPTMSKNNRHTTIPYQRQSARSSTSAMGRESRIGDRDEDGRQSYGSERREPSRRNKHRPSDATNDRRESRNSNGQWSDIKQSIKRKLRGFGPWI